MKGISYSRNYNGQTSSDESARRALLGLADGQEIIVRAGEVWLHLPGVTIPDAELTFQCCSCCSCCERRCDGEHRQPCRRCTRDAGVRLCLQEGGTVGAEYVRRGYERDDATGMGRWVGEVTHSLGEFSWDWSGHGATEWWFDDQAISLGGEEGDYTSQSGLTASNRRLVAYKRKVQVASFRDYGGDSRPKAEAGVIAAQFRNGCPEPYRGDFTGFAYGVLQEQDEYGTPSGATPIIGDDLDLMIEACLTGRPPVEKTVCRHLGAMQAYIVCCDPASLPRFLCGACRMQGVRWEEFLFANKADTCPYFLRAVKTVTQVSTPLPEWYEWQGTSRLMGSYARMSDGEWIAYETVYLSQRDQFVRHGVLLLNSRTREGWTYVYAGFIPRTIAEFRAKYGESGRQVQGYAGTRGGWQTRFGDRVPFLTEQAVAETPVWVSDDGELALLPCALGHHDELLRLAAQRTAVAGIEVVPLTRDGEEDPDAERVVADPQAFYTDEEGNEFYLLCIGHLWVGGLAIRRDGAELFRTVQNHGGRAFCFLRVSAEREEEVS